MYVCVSACMHVCMCYIAMYLTGSKASSYYKNSLAYVILESLKILPTMDNNDSYMLADDKLHPVVLAIVQGGQGSHKMIAEQLGKQLYNQFSFPAYMHGY